MNDTRPLPGEYYVGIAVGLILSIVTCGLYNVYWQYKQISAMNVLLGRHEFDFLKWLIFSILTCGLYHVYYEYRMAASLQEWLSARGRPVSPNLALICLVLSCLSLTVIADAIIQHDLNKLT